MQTCIYSIRANDAQCVVMRDRCSATFEAQALLQAACDTARVEQGHHTCSTHSSCSPGPRCGTWRDVGKRGQRCATHSQLGSTRTHLGTLVGSTWDLIAAHGTSLTQCRWSDSSTKQYTQCRGPIQTYSISMDWQHPASTFFPLTDLWLPMQVRRCP